MAKHTIGKIGPFSRAWSTLVNNGSEVKRLKGIHTKWREEAPPGTMLKRAQKKKVGWEARSFARSYSENKSNLDWWFEMVSDPEYKPNVLDIYFMRLIGLD